MTWRYLIRRLAQVPATVLAIVVATFLLIHLAPGDPVVALAGQSGDAAYYAEMRSRFGLERPLPQQLGTYLANVAQGDFGPSLIQGRPALQVVAERLPATLLLTGAALAVSTVAGLVFGSLAARRPGRPPDLLLRGAALLGYATPSFWLAQLAILFVAFRTGLFPIQGMTDPRRSLTGVSALLDVAHHLVLPALVLAAAEVALNTRLVRTGVMEASRSEYVRAARSRGLSERRVQWHALRTALLPLTTVIGGRVGMFFAGAALVEIVFAWPGLGRLLLASAQARDHAVLLAIFFVVAFSVVLANVVTDLVYARLDPRVRYE